MSVIINDAALIATLGKERRVIQIQSNWDLACWDFPLDCPMCGCKMTVQWMPGTNAVTCLDCANEIPFESVNTGNRFLVIL